MHKKDSGQATQDLSLEKNKKLIEHLRKLAHSYTILERELKDLTKKDSSNSDSIKELQQQKEELETLAKNYHITIEAFKEKERDFHLSRSRHDEEIGALTKQLTHLKERCLIDQNEIQTLKSKLNNVQSLESLEPSKETTTAFQNKLSENHILKESQNQLRNELETLTIQLQSTKEKNQLFHQYMEESKAQSSRDKIKIEKLASAIFEKDQRIKELQQLEVALKRTVDIKQELEKALENKTNECSSLQEEKRQIQGDIKDRCLHIEQLERVIQFLRERSQEAQLELNQLREEYQSSQEVILNLQEQLSIYKSQCIQSDEVFKQTENDKQEALSEIILLQNQIEQIKSQIEKKQEELNAKKTH